MTPRRTAPLLATLLLASSPLTARAEDPLPAQVEFNRDIRPILSDTCFTCHGPDKAKRKADLRLDLEASAKARIEDHFAIVPGKPAESELIRRITTRDDEDRMPPAKAGRQLTARQVALLQRWIEQGAPWQAHWSFIPPQRTPLPAVHTGAWPRNPIDHFILARLEREGLHPSAEADRATLLRRVSLDLTGLPPTLAEVDAFLADTSPPAYERVVDRLLDSPAYGERMASRWLDAARYADTSGYQSDGERSMWRWRDWVIDAFNRNHRGNAEGGIVPEEYAAEYVVDRVDTTATVWLGLTLGCARCHDHKYDPVSQREFYQLFAFFNNVPEKGRAVKIGNSPPVLAAPTAAQEKALAELDAQLLDAGKKFDALQPQIAEAQAAWEKQLTSSALDWTVTQGLQARYPLAGSLLPESGGAPAKWIDGAETFSPVDSRLAAEFDGRRFLDCGDVGNFGFFDKFSFTAWVQPHPVAAGFQPASELASGRQSPSPIPAGGAIISRMVESPEDSAFASDSEGYSVFLQNGRVQLRLTKRWLDDALRVETVDPIRAGAWQHLTVTYDGSRLAAGVKIYVNGQLQPTRALLDQLNQTFQTKMPLRIGAGGGPANRFRGHLGDVRVYTRVLGAEEAAIVAVAENITALAALPRADRTAAQLAKLRACFLAGHAPAAMREAHSRLADLRAERAALVESLPTVMVMEEMPAPRETFVLKRGEYDKRGDRVEPGVPASLPPFPAAAPRNRLGFAQWLVSPENPLTARVAVNAQWQMIFGTGLVKTAEDFGSQGESPSHPELLDWLATEFIRTGWDVKALLKTLVTSAAYRQSSRLTPELVARDPDNRLLARGPRVRLTAEMIRDQALAASGLLVREIGGPSVKPYQPKGLQKELSGTDYEPDHGDTLWRRSLYTFWKRTSPQPTMMTFDAAGREMCTVRPSRTSTPLQALALMNDVTFVEAARGLAQRTLREAAPSPDERARHLFRLVLQRPPKPAELNILRPGLDEHLHRFQANSQAAVALLTLGESPRDENLPVPELAAYTALAGLILNLDEAITKQ
jgi:hypothetical protein